MAVSLICSNICYNLDMITFENKNDPLAVLNTKLQSAGIDTSTWGTGSTKTLEHLAKEIADGETTLLVNENGELRRVVVVGTALVQYNSPDGKTYILREEKQVFKDGRERRRNMEQSVFEKMKPDENPEEAMVRGVQEELGITTPVHLTEVGTDEQNISSPSYPGLISQYIKHHFKTTLNDDQYKPEGYIEEQSDKSTFFVWKEICGSEQTLK